MAGPIPTVFDFAPALSERQPHTGLTFDYYGGNVLTTSGFVNVPEAGVLLPDNQFNFVECSDGGVVSSNTLGFTPGAIPMAKVRTYLGIIASTADRRISQLISNPATVIQGGGGGGGGGPTARYVHTQAVASATWTVVHNMNAFPEVTTVNGLNQVFCGDVVYLDVNTIQVNFGAPVTGKAYVT